MHYKNLYDGTTVQTDLATAGVNNSKAAVFILCDFEGLVSALLKWDSIPGLVVENAVKGKITPVLCEDIVKEYSEVLHRKKFGFLNEDIQAVIRGLIQQGIFVKPADIAEVVPDKKDIVFYAITMEAKKGHDAYLVTGNIRHFPIKPYVVTPREFVKILYET